MEPDLLNTLLLAIRALNATPDFNTGIPSPDDPQRTLRSYTLIPKLEAAARKAKSSAVHAPPGHEINRELLIALERAFDILDRIRDALHYEDGLPVTALEAREIEDIYNDAISDLAPFETLIRKTRGQL
jgi:hypothetical protein